MLKRITVLSNKKLSPEEVIAVEKYKRRNSGAHPKAIFVKKTITKAAWDRNYCYNPRFCNLSSGAIGKITVGFMAVNEIPPDCEEMDSNDLRVFDGHCERNNIRPSPFSLKKHSDDIIKRKEIEIKQLF